MEILKDLFNYYIKRFRKERKKKIMKAFLIVDMVNGFLEKEKVLYCGSESRKIIPNIIEKFNENPDIQRIYLCDTHSSNDSEFKRFPIHCLYGSGEEDLIKELNDYPGIIVSKNTFDGFVNTNLDSILKEYKIESLEVMGLCTDICIFHTSCHAKFLGYDVEINVNRVSSFSAENTQFRSLKYMEKIVGIKVNPLMGN